MLIFLGSDFHFKAVEGAALLTDADFREARPYLSVEAVLIHAEEGRSVPETHEAGENRADGREDTAAFRLLTARHRGSFSDARARSHWIGAAGDSDPTGDGVCVRVGAPFSGAAARAASFLWPSESSRPAGRERSAFPAAARRGQGHPVPTSDAGSGGRHRAPSESHQALAGAR